MKKEANAQESETNPAKGTAPGVAGGQPGFGGIAVAFAGRELRTLLRNRFVHVFVSLAVMGGFATTGLTPSISAIPFILLQLTLYLVPLFGILIGLSSAHAELEEQPLLLSQPILRGAFVAGKTLALVACLCPVLFLAFLPGLYFVPRPAVLLLLWGLGIMLGGVFICLGLAIGFTTRERSRGLIYALVAWLFLLIGFDLVAYAAAMLPLVQQQPSLWLAAILVNPVDTVRVAALFHLEEIPFVIPSDFRLAAFLLEHIVAWSLLVCAVWIGGLFLWSGRQVDRREI